MVVRERALVIVVGRRRQVVDVSPHSVGRRERDDRHARRVDVDREVGQQLLDELELVVEVGGADTGTLVDEEDQLDLAVGRATQ